MPPCAEANLVSFPPLVPELKLSNLEERLVAPRIPFMQLRELPRGGQLSLTGTVVNVPCDVSTAVSVLPRQLDDSATIALKIKRKPEYKHSYQFETIRPNAVRDAVTYLVHHGPLYRDEGITIENDWKSVSQNLQQFVDGNC